jgi:hypothetical protein
MAKVLATYRAVHATYLIHHETIGKELEQQVREVLEPFAARMPQQAG